MKGVFSALLLLAATCPARFTDPPACPPSPLASYHPHETDCSSYLRCQGGHLTVLSCPQGHLFDPNLGACDLATTCRDLDVKTADAECPETPKCIASEWGLTKPYPPDCTKYIYCDIVGNSIITDCSPEQHYGPEINRCAAPETAQCPVCGDLMSTTEATTEAIDCLSPPFCSFPEDVGENYADPTNCTLYYHCLEDMTEEIRKCPNNQHFSPEVSACRDPEVANCVLCSPELY